MQLPDAPGYGHRRRQAPVGSAAGIAIGIAALVAALATLGTGCTPSGEATGALNNPYTQENIKQFNDIDKSKKGVISLDQAVEFYTAKFAELDLNRDKFLDTREIAPLLPIMQATSPEDLVRRLDNNGDGKVSEKEFLILVNVLFQRSSSGDGTLTLKDAQKAPARAAPAGPPAEANVPKR